MATLRQLKKEEDERRAAEAALEAEWLAEEKRQAELDKEERDKVIQEATDRLRKDMEEAEEKRKKAAKEEEEEKRKKEEEERKKKEEWREDDNGNGDEDEDDNNNGNGGHYEDDNGNGGDNDGNAGESGGGGGGNGGDGGDKDSGNKGDNKDDDNGDGRGGGAVGVGTTDEEEMCSGLMAFHLEREERRIEFAGWRMEVIDYAQQKAARMREEKIKSLDKEISRITEQKNAEERKKRLERARRQKEEWMASYEEGKEEWLAREKQRIEALEELKRLEQAHEEEVEKIE